LSTFAVNLFITSTPPVLFAPLPACCMHLRNNCVAIDTVVQLNRS
jgi:hypothetical protein